jgi:hypothetical protein
MGLVKRQGRSARILPLLVGGIAIVLVAALGPSFKSACVIGIAMALPIYNRIAGRWTMLQSLSFTSLLLGLSLWILLKSEVPDMVRSPWLLVVFLFPALILDALDQHLTRTAEHTDATATPPAG